MNKEQKQVLQSQLNTEKETIKELKEIYKNALKDCEIKIMQLSARADMNPENLQSIIYQKNYQEVIKAQIEGVLANLQSDSFATVSEYLTNCYQEGYTGVMYDLMNQGIPIVMPIDQNAVIKAIQTDSKISTSLYKKMGEDVKILKDSIRSELSRGIANGSTWNDIAKRLSSHNMDSTIDLFGFKKAYNNSLRIARTEGHRVQIQSALDAQHEAKKKGADVVKQWDSTLDGKTRDTHRMLDGQIREIDEDFEVGGRKVSAPGMFGDPSEDCNCRCALLQRARWALDEDELKTLEERAEYFGLDKSKDFEDFKEKYLNISKEDIKGADSGGVLSNAQKMNPVNKYGVEIQFDYGKREEKFEQSKQLITSLSNEYNTRLEKVIIGTTDFVAGEVDISGAGLGLSSTAPEVAIHEFAHTLANSNAQKLGLTDDGDFWKEIRKINREYHRDVDSTQDTSRWISSYEHSSRKIDEFFAEAFAHAKMNELGLDIPKKYGSDFTYSMKVLEVVDKYFKK